MAEKKFNPIVYLDWFPIFCTMSEHDRSEVLLAISNFPDYEPEGVALWTFFKEQLRKQEEAYKEKCNKNRGAIKHRWSKNAESKVGANERIQANTNEYECIQANTNEYECIQANTNEYECIQANTNEYERIRTNTNVYECIPNKNKNKNKNKDSRAHRPESAAEESAQIPPSPDPFVSEVLEEMQAMEYERPVIPNKPRRAVTHRFTIEALPDDWREFCEQVRPDLNPQTTFTSFRAYFLTGNGSDKLRSDKGWNQSWQTWVKKEKATAQSPARRIQQQEVEIRDDFF